MGLYGTAVLLEELGNVIAHGGAGVVIASHSGHRPVGAPLMGPDGAFITGSDFLMDGGVTASYFYGELAPS